MEKLLEAALISKRRPKAFPKWLAMDHFMIIFSFGNLPRAGANLSRRTNINTCTRYRPRWFLARRGRKSCLVPRINQSTPP
jgi:hypothetical protein